MNLRAAFPLLLLTLPAAAANLTGLWEFNNPANIGEATSGNDLIVGGVHTHHASLADDGGNSLTGAITTMGNDVGSFLTANHDIAPNGGGTFVNEYSVVIDLFTPATNRGGWRAIFQTTSSPSGNDADYWIRTGDNHLGVGAIGYSDLPMDETSWTRLVITVDLRTSVTTYLDGTLHFTHNASDGTDGRHSLFPTGDQNIIHFFADDTAAENPPMNVGAIAIFDGALTDAEVATLGGPGDPIENPPAPVDPPVVTEQPAGTTTAQAGTSEDFEFLATDPTGQDVEFQVDWGNGASSPWTTPGPSGVVQTVSYAYPGAGSFNIRVRVRDSDGGVSEFVDIQTIVVSAAPTGPLVLAGLWKFDNPANLAEATVGNDLIFEGDTPTHATFLSDDSFTALDGVITTAVPVPSNRIRADHGIAPNGGGTFVNRYSIVADIFSPAGSRDSWRTIYQTDPGNATDGEYFIRPDNDGIGVGDLTYSDSPIDETNWIRLVLTVDLALTGGDAIAYVDGALHYNHTSNPAIDSRFALDSFLYFFTDESGENAPLNVGVLAIYDGVLTPEEVAALGAAGDPIGPETGERVNLTGITYDGTNPNAETLTVRWESEEGKLYNLRSTSDPAAADPIDWPIVAGQQELLATPPENVVTIPFPSEAARFFVVEAFDPPPVRIYFEDFEGGQGDWEVASTGAAGTEWTLGTPSNVGPPAANSGVNCFGTNLDSTYLDDAIIALRSPVIDLTTAEGATLNWAQSRDIEPFFDSGAVNILDAADDSLLAVVQGGIEDTIAGWEDVSRTIPAPALGKMIKVEFLFTADNFNDIPQAGWYIDDVEVTVR